jgi:predicted permease
MDILHDLRYAARTWRQTPVISCVVVLSLAFGFSANLTIYSWLTALVTRPLSGVPAQDRLVVVDGRSASGRDQRLSYPDLRDLSAQLRQVEGIVGYTYQPFSLSHGDHAERIWGQLVTANFFDVLHVRPILGRAFVAGEEVEGAGPVAVISDSLWHRRFNAAPDLLGQSIQINGQRLTIIGVAPPGFHGVAVGLLLDIWIPLGIEPLLGSGQPGRLLARDSRWLGAYARLNDGATVAAVDDELQAIGIRLRTAHRDNEAMSFTATTLADAPWGGTTVVKPVLRVLFVLVFLLLLVTSANVTSLLVMRAVGRRREFAARLALGASRFRLARQQFVESAVVGAVAIVSAATAALLSSRLFAALLPPTGFPIGFHITVDVWWFITSTLLAVGTIALTSTVPALLGISSPPATVLREEAANLIGQPRRSWFRSCLVGTQIALSVVLLITSATLVRALASSRAVDPGFDREHVLLAAIDLSHAGHSQHTGAGLLRRLYHELASIPGVDSISFAQRVPLDFGGRGIVAASIDGYSPANDEEVALALNHVGPGYLRTMRIPVLEGRELGLDDGESAERVAVVNERAAALYWKARGAINGRITLNGLTFRVVGVFADIKQDGLSQPAPPAVLIPLLQSYRPTVVVHVTAAGDPSVLTGPVRATVARLDPAVAVYDVRTMSAHMEIPTFAYRLGSTVSLALGLIALLLATLGLYASVSRDISCRRREMGIRMALGARRVELVHSLGASAVVTVAVGLVAGLALAVPAGRALGGTLAAVQTGEPSVYLFGMIATVFACSTAIYVPMRRALLTTPVVALREG